MSAPKQTLQAEMSLLTEQDFNLAVGSCRGMSQSLEKIASRHSVVTDEYVQIRYNYSKNSLQVEVYWW